MSRKILAIRVEHGRSGVGLRLMSKSRRGGTYTLRGSKRERGIAPGKATKERLSQLLTQMLPKTPSVG